MDLFFDDMFSRFIALYIFKWYPNFTQDNGEYNLNRKTYDKIITYVLIIKFLHRSNKESKVWTYSSIQSIYAVHLLPVW